MNNVKYAVFRFLVSVANDIAELLTALFRVANHFLHGIEDVLLDLITVLVIYAAPVAIASNTIQHLAGQFGMETFPSWAFGIAVEGIGFASVSIATRIIIRRESKERTMFLVLTLVAMALYLIIVVMVNTLGEVERLSVQSVAEAWQVGRPRLLLNVVLSLITVPAALIAGAKVAYLDTRRKAANEDLRRTLRSIADKYGYLKEVVDIFLDEELPAEDFVKFLGAHPEFRKVSETFGNFPETSQPRGELPGDFRKLSPEHIDMVLALRDPAAIAKKFNVTEKTAKNWLERLKEEGSD